MEALTTPEVDIIKEAFALYQQAQQRAEQAGREAQAQAQQLPAICRTIIQLRGLNPAAYDIRMLANGDAELFEIPAPEVPADSPPTLAVVPDEPPLPGE